MSLDDIITKGTEAARDIFLRFGSTRGLALAMTETFLGFLAYHSPMESVTFGTLGFICFCLTTLSFHMKPHIDRKPV
jgi:hypothetical protein